MKDESRQSPPPSQDIGNIKSSRVQQEISTHTPAQIADLEKLREVIKLLQDTPDELSKSTQQRSIKKDCLILEDSGWKWEEADSRSVGFSPYNLEKETPIGNLLLLPTSAPPVHFHDTPKIPLEVSLALPHDAARINLQIRPEVTRGEGKELWHFHCVLSPSSNEIDDLSVGVRDEKDRRITGMYPIN